MTTITTATTLPAPACSWPLSLRDMALLSLLTHPQNTSHTEWHLLLEFPRSLRQQPHSSSYRKDTLCGARSPVSSLLCSLILAKSPEHGSSNTKGSQNLVRYFHSSTQILFFFDKADLCHKSDFVVMESEIAAATVQNTYFLCSMTQGAPFLDPSAISTGAQLHYRQTRSSLPPQWKSSKFPYKSVDANWYMRGGKA